MALLKGRLKALPENIRLSGISLPMTKMVNLSLILVGKIKVLKGLYSGSLHALPASIRLSWQSFQEQTLWLSLIFVSKIKVLKGL
jgi:hypothetical protein